jgi:hypothetical protein
MIVNVAPEEDADTGNTPTMLLFWPTWLCPTPPPALPANADPTTVTVALLTLPNPTATTTDDDDTVARWQQQWPACRVITGPAEVQQLLTTHAVGDCPSYVLHGRHATSSDGPTPLPLPDNPDDDNTDAATWFARAMDAHEAFDLPAAARGFAHAAARDPSHRAAWFNLASVLHMGGLPGPAVRCTERVLALDPQDMVAHAFLWALTQVLPHPSSSRPSPPPLLSLY